MTGVINSPQALEVVDAQLHEPTPYQDIPRSTDLYTTMTEILLGSMDAVGVRAAVINAIDAAWGDSAVAAHPDRLALVFSIRTPTADWRPLVRRAVEEPSVLGVRLVLGRRPSDLDGSMGRAALSGGAYDELLAACQNEGVPVFIFATGILDAVVGLVERLPELVLVIDHLGLRQPPMDSREPVPWQSLGAVLDLARYPNVHLKLCGVPALSDEPYPYPDVWPYVLAIVQRFGAERVMWASDIGRFQGRIGSPNVAVDLGEYPGRHTYAESVGYLRECDALTRDQRARILGGTARHVLGWHTTPRVGDRPGGADS